MSLAPHRILTMLTAAAGAVAVALSPAVMADPDIDAESAAAVIQDLREEGYTVEVNGGVSSEDTTLLASCKVTQIHNPGDPTTDPTPTTTIYVDVACPISHG